MVILSHSYYTILLGKLGDFQVNINLVLIILSKICVEHWKVYRIEPYFLLKCAIWSVVFAWGSHPCQQEWFFSVLTTDCHYYQLLLCHLAHQSLMMERAAVTKTVEIHFTLTHQFAKEDLIEFACHECFNSLCCFLLFFTWSVKYSDIWRRTLHGIICTCTPACAHIAILWELLGNCLATGVWETDCTHSRSDHTNPEW
jgi:hypothetical protein